jgi:hypothetical protein
LGDWHRTRRYWFPFALAYGLQAVCIVGFFGLRLYSDYTGVRLAHILEGSLLSVGVSGLTLALVFGIAAVRRSAPSRSRFPAVFALAGVLLAIGTFTTVYLASR